MKVGDYPKVSIITVNYNNVQDCLDFVKICQTIKYPNFDIIVIDNGSTIGNCNEIKDRFPYVTLIKNKANTGWGGGNNTGIKLALKNGADYVWLMNNDASLESQTLTQLVQEAESSKEIGMVSPVIRYYSDHTKIENCGSSVNKKKFSIEHVKSIENLKYIDESNIWLWGTALLIKKELIETIGYFDERYFIYCEDREYSYRAIKNSFKIRVVEQASIFHKSHFSGDEKKLPPYYFYYLTRNDYLFWIERIKGLEKNLFIRKYLCEVINKANDFNNKSDQDIVDALLDGAYCAFKNYWGKWDQSRKMPEYIKKFILKSPNLCMDLLEFKFVSIIKSALNRIINKLKRHK